MGREHAEELFSEKIDRLLANEDVQYDAVMDHDMRTALDFARTMRDLRPAPSAEFQSRLKARLLQKLNERKERSGTGWFWRFIPHEPVWQVLAVLAVMVVVGGVLWGTFFRPAPPGVVSVPTIQPPAVTAPPATSAAPTTTSPAVVPGIYLQAGAGTDKPVYASGETVRIDVTWQNVTNMNLTVEQFPPLLSLMQKSSGQPVYTFPAGRDPRVLAPGETASVSLEWTQTDHQGRRVAPGGYYLELEEMYYQGNAVPMNLTRPVDFNILPASTGNGRVLNFEQTQTVNGISLTLQRIEIDETGFMVSVFSSSPPDYVLQPGTTALSPTLSYRALAGYSLDGNWVRDIGASSVEYFGHGIAHTWYVPGPAAAEAGDLVFTVYNTGGWSGPWEFKAALK
ncbi:MAG: hypothetical protein PHU23_15855 [Dehalococcoidales bacterium]|nr:hypothetical protein [Dehalococcoidales bacterium]